VRDGGAEALAAGELTCRGEQAHIGNDGEAAPAPVTRDTSAPAPVTSDTSAAAPAAPVLTRLLVDFLCAVLVYAELLAGSALTAGPSSPPWRKEQGRHRKPGLRRQRGGVG